MSLNDYLLQIRHEAEASRVREVCGFLLLDGKGSLCIMPAHNTAPGNDDWEIHPELYVRAIKTGRLYGLYHSHIIVGPELTKDDLLTADRALLPMVCYSIKTQTYSFYRPRGAIKPLYNRSFVLGASDCYTLIQDYYELNLGLKLPFYPRNAQTIQEGFDPGEHLKDYMTEVCEPQAGDLLTFSISNNGRENHAGIYLGDQVFLHQLMGRESCAQKLTVYWLNQMQRVFRPR